MANLLICERSRLQHRANNAMVLGFLERNGNFINDSSIRNPQKNEKNNEYI